MASLFVKPKASTHVKQNKMLQKLAKKTLLLALELQLITSCRVHMQSGQPAALYSGTIMLLRLKNVPCAGGAPLMSCATAASASGNYTIQRLARPYFRLGWAGI